MLMLPPNESDQPEIGMLLNAPVLTVAAGLSVEVVQPLPPHTWVPITAKFPYQSTASASCPNRSPPRCPTSFPSGHRRRNKGMPFMSLRCALFCVHFVSLPPTLDRAIRCAVTGTLIGDDQSADRTGIRNGVEIESLEPYAVVPGITVIRIASDMWQSSGSLGWPDPPCCHRPLCTCLSAKRTGSHSLLHDQNIDRSFRRYAGNRLGS